MKVTAFIRKTAKKNDLETKATIYFRLRDGRKDIKAASELSISPNHWSPEKQAVLLSKISFPYSLLFFAKMNGSRVNLKDSCDFFSSYALMLHILDRTLQQQILHFSLRMKTFLGDLRYICFRIHSL